MPRRLGRGARPEADLAQLDQLPPREVLGIHLRGDLRGRVRRLFSERFLGRGEVVPRIAPILGWMVGQQL